jgi:uncharacterized protein
LVTTIRVGDIQFEWDAEKAAANVWKHGITFAEAVEVFEDPLALVQPDLVHPERFQILGESQRARILFVVYTERIEGEVVRIISARKATPHERRSYATR